MSKKSNIIFITSCLIFFAAFFFYIRNFNSVTDYNYWVNHTADVIFSFDTLANDVKSAEIVLLYKRMEKHGRLQQYYVERIHEIPDDINRLRYLTRDNNMQSRRIDTIETLLSFGVNASRATSLSDSAVLSNYISVGNLIGRGISNEKDLLSVRKTNLDKSNRSTGWLVILFAATSISIIIGITASNVYQVSRRKKVEIFLQSVLNTSQNVIMTMQAVRTNDVITDFKIIFVNDSVQKQTGFMAEQLIGKTVLTLSPAAAEKGLMQRYRDVCETGVMQEFENSYVSDQHTRCYRVMLAKLHDGVTCSLYDITDLKSSQKELQQKIIQLEHTNNELEQFAYVASHDLQEPLRKIRTFAGLAAEQLLQSEESPVKEYLNKVIHSAGRMSKLISDLLDLSYLSQQQHAYTLVNLNTILKEVVNDFELIIQEKQAVIQVGNLQDMEGIPMQMNQLFYNLLNNALKFTRDYITPVISISSVPLSPEQVIAHKLNSSIAYQLITVSDNGIGFESIYAEKIFVIFQRLNSRAVYAGSGIGLALCHKIVKIHQGTITATSVVNEGATFNIILPLVQQV